MIDPELLALIAIIFGEIIIILFGFEHISSKMWILLAIVFLLWSIVDNTLSFLTRILVLLVGALALACAKFGPEEY